MKHPYLIFLLLLPSALPGQSLFESAGMSESGKEDKKVLEINGYARGAGYLGFDRYNFATLMGELSLQSKVKKNNAVVFADLRVRDGVKFGEQFTEVELKEAYAGFSSEKADILLGNQIISWGRTDGFNPSNGINGADYFFLTGEPDDQKMPNFMLRAKYRVSPHIDLDLIAIPVYKPSKYRYDLFDMGEGVHFGKMPEPEQEFKNSGFAARLNVELPNIGFSVSCFNGYSPNYGFDVENVDFSSGKPVISNIAKPYKKSMIGFDLAIPVQLWIIRGEGALNITGDYKNNMHIPNPDFHNVVALERNLGSLTAIVQYIGKYTFNFREAAQPLPGDLSNPMEQIRYAREMVLYELELFNRKQFYQQKESNHALMAILTKPFAYETINVELSALYNFTSQEYLLRPKIAWNVSDALTAKAGVSYMKGDKKEIFYYSAQIMNGAFVELKVNF